MKVVFEKNSVKASEIQGVADYEIDLTELTNEILYKLINHCSLNHENIQINKKDDATPFAIKMYDAFFQEFSDEEL